MSSSMNTILIIGGTSGIGKAFAERFHSMGKKVIVTGRREQRLTEIQKSLAGLEIYTMDMNDLSAISTHVEKLFSQYPSIDTVWVNGGIQYMSSIKDISSSSDERISEEITTNVTAPMVLARHCIPLLLKQKTETNFMITTSGLGFVPVGSLFPVYCPTKAAIHTYLVGIRQALKDANINVLELVPPFVDTELGSEHRATVDKMGLKPMTLEGFTDEIFDVLENNEAKFLKEVVAGTAIGRVDAWRSSIGKILANNGLGG